MYNNLCVPYLIFFTKKKRYRLQTKIFKYAKSRDVKNPIVANEGKDAGVDFYAPTINKQLIKDIIAKNGKLNYRIYISKQLLNDNILQFKKEITSGKIVQNIHNDINFIRVYQDNRILIPAGIYVDLPQHTSLIAFNKSGIAHKSGLIVGSCVVDNGYQGQIHISLINTTDNYVDIFQNSKIVQFILINVNNIKMPVEVNKTQLYSEESNRGDGGFGSSGLL